MTGVLFWNVDGNDLGKSVGRLAAVPNRHVQIVVLAEMGNKHGYGAELTQATGQAFRELAIPGCTYLHVFTSLSTSELVVARAGRRHAILRLLKPNKVELLLALTHLPPKGPGPNSADNQRSVAFDLWNEIRSQEISYSHDRTVLVGDLNADPFETALISSDGLHSTMARDEAAKATRTVNGTPKGPLFLNPMWPHWGDALSQPPGTYYKACSLTDCLFWHVFDQVLLRSAADPYFDHKSLQILDGDGHDGFRSKNGIPKRKKFSDHLPIIFRLTL